MSELVPLLYECWLLLHGVCEQAGIGSTDG